MKEEKVIIKKHVLKESFRFDPKTLDVIEQAITDMMLEVSDSPAGQKNVIVYAKNVISSITQMFMDETEEMGGDVEYTSQMVSGLLVSMSKQLLLISREIKANY